MNEEYKLHFEVMSKYIHWDPQLGEQENRENGQKFFDAIELLCKSHDSEILENLLDFFTKENERYGGVCETIKSQIGANFTLDQIIGAFYKKFDTLAENDLGICIEMSMWCVRNEHGEQFRRMFNAVKSKHSKEIVEDLKASALEYDWEEDAKKAIDALEEDMKSW
jgi:hypothetical protein